MTSDKMAKQADAMAQALISEVNAVLVTMTYACCIREKIDAMHANVLDYMDVRDEAGQRITDPHLSYRMADIYCDEFYRELDKRNAEMGYKVKPGNCPALIAENLQMEAERILVAAASAYFPNMTWDSILCSKNGLDNLRKYIDLLIKLVINAPGYRQPTIAA